MIAIIWAAIRAYWRPLAVAAGLLAMAAGIGWYGHSRYQDGRADERADAELAAAQQYARQAEALNAQVAALQSKIEALENDHPKIITQYKDRIVRVPLPADCVIDDGRLHDIQSAIRAANSAR